MKINLTFILVCSYILAYSTPQLDSLFYTANDNYQSENYPQAIDNYHTILDSNYTSFEVYYNLANSYYQFGKIPKSIYYYEKALSIRKDEDCNNNLTLAQKRIKLVEPIPQLFYTKWWNSLSSGFTIKVWSIFLISFVWLTAVLLILFLKNRKKRIFNTLMMSISTTCVLIGLMYNANVLKNKEYCVILEQAKLFDNNSNYQSNRVIDGGNKVLILEKETKMTLVQLQDGQKGWIDNTKFKSLK